MAMRRWRPAAVKAALRGIRIRLAVLYSVAAAVLITAGALGIAFLLHRGLIQNVDAALIARDEQLTLAGAVVIVDSSPAASGDLADRFTTVTQLYSANGTLQASQPSTVAALLSLKQVAAAGDTRRLTTVSVGGDRVRVLWHRLGSEQDGAILVVGASLSQVHDDATDINQALLLAAPILVVFAGGGTWLLSGAALRPVERMRAEAAQLRASDRARRLTVPTTGDELEALGRTLNDLLDGLHRALQRQQDFVADAGHELRTPLAVLRTELELADRATRTPDELRDSIRHAASEVDRLSDLANTLLELARTDSRPIETTSHEVDISALLDDSVRAYRTSASSAQIELIADFAPMLRAAADAASLRRAVDNVIANAVAHTPRHGTVVVGASAVESSSADGRGRSGSMQIIVRDTGPGLPPAFLPHAFERFSRSDAARARDPARSSTGLGLAIVGSVLAAHGGEATARNLAAGGLEIILSWPSAPPPRP